jgi:hypothetical protein
VAECAAEVRSAFPKTIVISTTLLSGRRQTAFRRRSETEIALNWMNLSWSHRSRLSARFSRGREAIS